MKKKDWFATLIDSNGALKSSAPVSNISELNETPAGGVKILPFLKWAGGKRWLMPTARLLVQQRFNTYYEPFLGSGAMYFALRPAMAVLSDSNEDLMNTYAAIRADWRAVYMELKRHHRNHSPEYYYRVRASLPRTAHTRAARFIYLNRTCWNGLYRVNRDGVFNTPVGSKKHVVLETDDFELVSSILESAVLANGDFEKIINMAGDGDLVFADPPYTVRHQFNGFIKYNEKLFSWADQERLMEALRRAKSRGAIIFCTNADHQSVRELYEKFFSLTAVSRYSAISGTKASRGTFAELIITG
ncbi:DNA adenine methylase [Rhodanobacter sp. UC4436_H3]